MTSLKNLNKLEYLKTIGIVNIGTNGVGFSNPYDIAFSSDDRAFVINRHDAPINFKPENASAIRMGILNYEEEYLGEFGYGFGDGEGQFKLPVAMCFDSKDRLYVTDELNNRITVFNSSGKYLFSWGIYGSGIGEIDGPAGITIDNHDNVYIADQNNHRVQKFTSDGQFITSWGGFGCGNGELNMPWGICTDSKGDIYVADWRNNRVQQFTNNGDFKSCYGDNLKNGINLNRPSSVAVDDSGILYIADWGNHKVKILNRDGDLISVLDGEATLSKWAKEWYDKSPDQLQSREKANLIPELPSQFSTPYQKSAQTEPYFWGPVSVKIDANKRLYVVESLRHRIQVFSI